MKTGELFKRRLNFNVVGVCWGVLGVCQSIDDGAETALTGGLQDPVVFQGGGMKFSKIICEPSKISLLCILLNVMFFLSGHPLHPPVPTQMQHC